MATVLCILGAFLAVGVTAQVTVGSYNETAALMFIQEDRNRDGFLSTNETLGSFLKFDFNGDSRIDRNEYTCFQISDHPELGNFANAVFDEYDYNNDSVLEDSDLLHFYHSMDINGDSLVEKEEFVDFWVTIFYKHEGYLLHGHVHPAHNPKACEHVHVCLTTNSRYFTYTKTISIKVEENWTEPDRRQITVDSYNETAELMFTQEDRNHDGLLSTNETIEAFFKFDFNGDSRIQRNEYTCFQISDHPEIGNFANAVFDEYDHNNDSMLEDSDLLHFYHSMDINGDSLVEKQEFVDSWIKIFKRHEHYLLHGHVHPEHNPHACEHLDVGFNFKPYDEYATKMFVAEDGDHDGQLSIAESVAAFRRYDANGDSKISRTEYACFQRDLHPGLGDFAHALYDEYDSNGDDLLDDHDIRSFYGKMDLDGNFQVGQVEFVTFWEKIFKKYEHYHVNGAHHPANTHACAHGN